MLKRNPMCTTHIEGKLCGIFFTRSILSPFYFLLSLQFSLFHCPVRFCLRDGRMREGPGMNSSGLARRKAFSRHLKHHCLPLLSGLDLPMAPSCQHTLGAANSPLYILSVFAIFFPLRLWLLQYPRNIFLVKKFVEMHCNKNKQIKINVCNSPLMTL